MSAGFFSDIAKGAAKGLQQASKDMTTVIAERNKQKQQDVLNKMQAERDALQRKRFEDQSNLAREKFDYQKQQNAQKLASQNIDPIMQKQQQALLDEQNNKNNIIEGLTKATSHLNIFDNNRYINNDKIDPTTAHSMLRSFTGDVSQKATDYKSKNFLSKAAISTKKTLDQINMDGTSIKNLNTKEYIPEEYLDEKEGLTNVAALSPEMMNRLFSSKLGEEALDKTLKEHNYAITPENRQGLKKMLSGYSQDIATSRTDFSDSLVKELGQNNKYAADTMAKNYFGNALQPNPRDLITAATLPLLAKDEKGKDIIPISDIYEYAKLLRKKNQKGIDELNRIQYENTLPLEQRIALKQQRDNQDQNQDSDQIDQTILDLQSQGSQLSQPPQPPQSSQPPFNVNEDQLKQDVLNNTQNNPEQNNFNTQQATSLPQSQQNVTEPMQSQSLDQENETVKNAIHQNPEEFLNYTKDAIKTNPELQQEAVNPDSTVNKDIAYAALYKQIYNNLLKEHPWINVQGMLEATVEPFRKILNTTYGWVSDNKELIKKSDALKALEESKSVPNFVASLTGEMLAMEGVSMAGEASGILNAADKLNKIPLAGEFLANGLKDGLVVMGYEGLKGDKDYVSNLAAGGAFGVGRTAVGTLKNVIFPKISKEALNESVTKAFQNEQKITKSEFQQKGSEIITDPETGKIKDDEYFEKKYAKLPNKTLTPKQQENLIQDTNTFIDKIEKKNPIVVKQNPEIKKDLSKIKNIIGENYKESDIKTTSDLRKLVKGIREEAYKESSPSTKKLNLEIENYLSNRLKKLEPKNETEIVDTEWRASKLLNFLSNKSDVTTSQMENILKTNTKGLDTRFDNLKSIANSYFENDKILKTLNNQSQNIIDKITGITKQIGNTQEPLDQIATDGITKTILNVLKLGDIRSKASTERMVQKIVNDMQAKKIPREKIGTYLLDELKKLTEKASKEDKSRFLANIGRIVTGNTKFTSQEEDNE